MDHQGFYFWLFGFDVFSYLHGTYSFGTYLSIADAILIYKKNSTDVGNQSTEILTQQYFVLYVFLIVDTTVLG